LPRQRAGIALGEHLDRLLPDDQGIAFRAYVLVEPAVDRVVAQQVRQRLGVRDVVDGHELEPGLAETGSKHVAADTPEAVDADTDRHAWNLSSRARPVLGARKLRGVRIPTARPKGQGERGPEAGGKSCNRVVAI